MATVVCAGVFVHAWRWRGDRETGRWEPATWLQAERLQREVRSLFLARSKPRKQPSEVMIKGLSEWHQRDHTGYVLNQETPRSSFWTGKVKVKNIFPCRAWFLLSHIIWYVWLILTVFDCVSLIYRVYKPIETELLWYCLALLLQSLWISSSHRSFNPRLCLMWILFCALVHS